MTRDLGTGRPAWMWIIVALGVLASVRPLVFAVGLFLSEARNQVSDADGLASGIGGVILVAVLPPLILWGLWAWRDRPWMFALALVWSILGLGLLAVAGLGPIGPWPQG